MTFLDYLAAQDDHNAGELHERLQGLGDGANDLREVIAHLRATLDGFEQAVAQAEAQCRWWEWHTIKQRAWAARIDAGKKAAHQEKRLTSGCNIRML
jgi:hypothetical protein